MPTVDLSRILIIRTDRIGDVVLSLPVATALRRRYPEAELTMLVAPYTAELVEGHPDLDRVLVDDVRGAHAGPGGFATLVRELRRRDFQAALLLHPTLRLAAAMRFAGIPIRVGTGYRAYQLLFTDRVYEHRKYAEKHEVDCNLSLAGVLGAPTAEARPYVRLDDGDLAAAREVLAAGGWRIPEPLVVIHPGTGGSARNWPEASYVDLGARLLKRPGLRLAITGSGAESPLVNRLASAVRNAVPGEDDRVLALAGRFGIRGLAALLQHARLVVSGSTGPMHMAAAVGAPTLALFCPIRACRPERWGPYGNRHEILMIEKDDCTDCPGHGGGSCPCMESIAVDAAEAAAARLLDEPGGSPHARPGDQR